jgi:hypothetical protein
MNVQTRIDLVEAELAQLKVDLETATVDERIAIHQRIAAKENQLTALINLLSREAPPGNFTISFHSNIFIMI